MTMLLYSILKYQDIETIEVIQDVSNISNTKEGLTFYTPSSIPNSKRYHFVPNDEIIKVMLEDSDGNIFYIYQNPNRGNNHE